MNLSEGHCKERGRRVFNLGLVQIHPGEYEEDIFVRAKNLLGVDHKLRVQGSHL